MSKFLEQVDRADPTRSQYKIGLLDHSGEVLKTVDVSGVEAAWDIFDSITKVVAGELDFEADDGIDYGGGNPEVEDAENVVGGGDKFNIDSQVRGLASKAKKLGIIGTGFGATAPQKAKRSVQNRDKLDAAAIAAFDKRTDKIKDELAAWDDNE